MSSRPSPVGSWKENVIEDACLSDASNLSGLNSQRGTARGSHLTNTGLRYSSSNSILGDANLPVALWFRQTPLIRMDW
jgi:hypothetical protein